MKRVLFFANLILFILSAQIVRANTYTIDPKGNVVFTKTIEGLSLDQEQVYNAALKYLQEAYKDTNYKISISNKEKGIVVGEGSFLAFHQSSNLVKTYTFNIDFWVRVDAKDGRARVQFIAKQYKVTSLSDIGDEKVENVNISEVAPFADHDHSRRYYKAYDDLKPMVDKTLNAVSEAIKSTPALMLEDENW